MFTTVVGEIPAAERLSYLPGAKYGKPNLDELQ